MKGGRHFVSTGSEIYVTSSVYWLISGCINLGVNYALFPVLGIWSAVISTITAYSFMFFFTYWFTEREFKFSWSLRVPIIFLVTLCALACLVEFSAISMLMRIAIILIALIYSGFSLRNELSAYVFRTKV